MTKREKLKAKIRAIGKKIILLENEVQELWYENLLLCDKQQWFTEKKETHGRGKKKREILVGRIHWKEDFKDQDTDKVITIERSQVIRQDGKWV